MSKRKAVRFAEGEEKRQCIEKEERTFKSKHSLDSDEEEEGDEKTNENYVLRDEDLDGQEDDTIYLDEGTKITPFNLREEMEEGYFDAQGNYFLNKDEDIR